MHTSALAACARKTPMEAATPRPTCRPAPLTQQSQPLRRCILAALCCKRRRIRVYWPSSESFTSHSHPLIRPAAAALAQRRRAALGLAPPNPIQACGWPGTCTKLIPRQGLSCIVWSATPWFDGRDCVANHTCSQLTAPHCMYIFHRLSMRDLLHDATSMDALVVRVNHLRLAEPSPLTAPSSSAPAICRGDQACSCLII